MADWNTPVFDRTYEDVVFAINKIAEWSVTEFPEVYDLKGCLCTSDLNRIEGNIAYLTEKLAEYGYSPSTYTRKWEISGTPNEDDVNRILNNVRELITAYYQREGAPSVPPRLINYEEVNSLEENLFLIKSLLDAMEGSFKYSDTFCSGSTMNLPIRR